MSFSTRALRARIFAMRQEFDYAGVEGRLLSSSYAPGPEHPKHAPMLRELRRIFDHNKDGRSQGRNHVASTKTRIYFGRLRLICKSGRHVTYDSC